MINLSELVGDPDFCQPSGLTVLRSTGHFGPNGWDDERATLIVSPVIAYPSSAKELEQLPEGDRVKGNVTFVTRTELFVTHSGSSSGVSDLIMWGGRGYRILNCMPYSDFGFFVSLGVRTDGD